MFLSKVLIKRPVTNKPVKGCIITIPGRGVPSSVLMKFCKYTCLRHSIVASLVPYKYAWYPLPNGINDQDASIAGLPHGVEAAAIGVEMVKNACGLTNSQIVLLGFSAGSVIALQLAMQTEEPFAGCVALAGAILETDKVSPAKNQTPFILQHNKDDACFD